MEDIDTGIKLLEKEGLCLKPGLLEELAADPDIFTPSQLMTAERRSSLSFIQDLSLALSKKEAGRGVLTVDNPVDWDQTPTFYQATSIAHGHILHFKQVWRADGYSLGDLLYSLPLAPCQKKQIAIIDWERREAVTRVEAETAEERLFATLSRDRDISEITRAAAAESLRAGSKSEVDSWSAGGGFGFGADGFVIGGGGGGGGSGATSEAWQASARQVSANSLQQLRDSTMQAASAVRSRRSTVVQTMHQGETMRVQTEVVANHNHCHAMTVQYFEILRHLLVTQELMDVQECLFVPLLMTHFDSGKTLRWREALSRSLRDRRLLGGFDALERIRLNYASSDLPTGSYAQQIIQHLDGELQIAFTIARPRDPSKDENFHNYINDNWGFWGGLLGGNAGDIYNSFLKNQQDKGRVFREQLARRVAEAFIANLSISLVGDRGIDVPVKLDPTLVSDYREGVPLYVRLNSLGNVPALRREQITGIRIRATYALPPYSKVTVHTAFLRYRTEHFNHHLCQNARVMDDLSFNDEVFLSTPLDPAELRNPRKEDQEISRRLLKHLNENLEYYHRVIWLSMDPNRRYMLLDGFLAPNSGGRSVASVVENRLIGIIGNCMILPVAPGFNLDPTYHETDAKDLLDVYAPLIPVPPVRISVPTRGVFAEASLGSCNSCETKDESRFWRWEEASCPDQPTPIESVSPESRRAEPPEMGNQSFPAPIIAMQNAPAAPDPTGLAATLGVLAKPDLFRDITGLTETQKNALAALQSAFGMAQAFGTQGINQATNLAMQRNMVRDIDKTMRTIQQAQREGLLNDDQAKSLTESAVRSMIGGSTQMPTKPLTTEQVEKVTRTAGEQDAFVSLSRQPGGESLLVDARPQFPSVREPLKEHCGFFGPNNVLISEDSLREAIRVSTTNERLKWFDATGNVLKENQPSQFGLLVNYWLSRFSTIRPTTLQSLQAKAIDPVINYGQLLNANATDAQVAAEAARVRADLLVDAPDAGSPSNLNNLIEQSLISARFSHFDDPTRGPWSAVFVTYNVRNAAIQSSLEALTGNTHVGQNILLKGSSLHSDYVLEAYRRRFGPDGRNGTYHAFRISERTPQVGDIIVQDRRAGSINDVVDYNDIPRALAGGLSLHGDIVVEVPDDVDYVVAIGGNLGNSVKRRRFPLDANRYLVVERVQLYTQEDNNGNLPTLPDTNTSPGLHTRSTGRIFTLLSPVKMCAVIPGQQVDEGVIV